MRLMAGAVIAALVAVVVAVSPTSPLPQAEALSGSEFDPGYIISDSAFYDGAAMSEAEIQQFLNQRVAQCGNSRCLKQFTQTTPTRDATPRCARYQGAASESAARILYKVQTACGISAKVLLVTLQKEQSVVTASSPTDWQIRAAMGYGCPDTAACDSLYYGFFNQVYTAAAQFQRYRQNPTFFRHQVGVANQVYLHPASNPAISNPPRCGSVTVTIRNAATAGLYNYTPYAPNQAALSNLYGVGDSCSSYGNRNFWRFYNEWFGSPTTGVESGVPAGVTVGRFAGADRYEVSVLVSQAAYPQGADVVYVATGQNFPDGLAAAPAAAAAGAPLLLTPTNASRANVEAEIRRLAPSQIVVVGGAPSVSDAVYESLSRLAPSIRRDSGPDRYAAAHDIALKGFPEGARTAYLVRGDLFPDALTAGAVAGAAGAPILLVRPSDTVVDEALASTLTRLGVRNVVITGSTASVSGPLGDALRLQPGIQSVIRYGAANRYDAGLAVSRAGFPRATSAYVASGTNFPDAMTAAAVAGATNRPLLLSNGTCVRRNIVQYIGEAGITRVDFLGSTVTLRSSVSDFLRC